jgi:cholesterol transport system auxiliary component
MRLRFLSWVRIAVIVGLALACTACAGLFGGKERTPSAIYVLALAPAGTAASTSGCGTLEVRQPDAAPGFATARMVYQREPHRLEPFAFSRWAEPPAAMVQAAILESLSRSGLFAAVLPAPAHVPPDFALDSDALSVLQVFEGEASHTDLDLNVRLVDMRHARLLAAQRLSVSVPAEANPKSGVDAANRALAQLLDELLEVTRRSVSCTEQSSATSR